jgi:hypothetical protein
MELVKDIFNSNELLDFWPTAKQSARDRVLATTRFVLYASVITYLITRDSRIFALAIVVLCVLYYLWSAGLVTDGKIRPTNSDGRAPSAFRGEVVMPTQDNIMGNVLLSDYTDYPDRPSAAWYPSVRQEVKNLWSQVHPFERVRDAERNFYTMPVSTIPSDQNAFAQAAYGKKFAPMCKDQGGEACDIDNSQFHFPERTQMRGGNGR